MIVPVLVSAQRITESRFTTLRPSLSASALRVTPDEPETKQPNGKQVVIGYMGAVVVGFLAWRVFDEPAGRHVKVRDDWGYTPDANTAFGVGSWVGSSLAVWLSGRHIGAKGSLLGTALGAALPTIPILMKRDDPLLPMVAAIFGAPVQGIMAYVGYRATAK